jgi:Holliday junction resolvase RusA-like endonuclease
MSEIKKWIFFLPPQTHIRTTQAENWMFAQSIDADYLKKFGLKKYNERIAKGSKNPGTPLNYYNRKKRIQKYWDYKRALKALADEQKFVMPTEGAWLKFFISTPSSWGKKKKLEKSFTLHDARPDCDNFCKAAMDSLMGEDKAISDFRASKLWYDGPGYIEITIGELSPVNGYSKYVREDKIK